MGPDKSVQSFRSSQTLPRRITHRFLSQLTEDELGTISRVYSQPCRQLGRPASERHSKNRDTVESFLRSRGTAPGGE